MGLFSRKPVLPDYRNMSVEQRMRDRAWSDVVSGVPGFGNAILVANADNGHIMGLGTGLTNVTAGILTITSERVGYAYAGTYEISQITQSVHKPELRHKGAMFIIMFNGPQNAWTFMSDDHAPLLRAFATARA
jgi:hypothetical protein